MAQGKDGFRFDFMLLAVAVLGIVAAGGAAYLGTRDGVPGGAPARPLAGPSGADRVAAQAALLALQAAAIERGLTPDFDALAAEGETLDAAIEAFGEAASANAGKDGQDRARAVTQAGGSTRAALDRLLGSRAAAGGTAQALQRADAAGDRVVQIYREAIERMRAGLAAPGRLLLASEQAGRAERLRYLARRLQDAGIDRAALSQQIEAEAAALLGTHGQLAGEGPVGLFLRENLAQVEALAAELRALVQMPEAASALAPAAAALATEARKLQAAAAALSGLVATAGEATPVVSDGAPTVAGYPLQALVLPALGLALVALLSYAVVNIGSVRGRIRKAEEKESAQQAAILGLLDEISSLADGDLTVRASVTGAFTGAIADSINYTVETLRTLVGTINETAVEISAAATSTQSLAQIMRETSDGQARDVAQMAQQVGRSSVALSGVAGRAEELSREATRSVEVAHNGASTVGRSIQGMAALREQIQDTAKRIKRLGESSQEIGNIIEFINDIAEQTNTLALNASIQAAMAGESGKGFAVVADEVQRLAERAAGATRQIETLVKTIQADTNEAIVSMERSTSNVIAGARSAEEAGQALTRIEATSTDIARLIREISAEARSEAAQATRISEEMQVVRGVAQQAADRAQGTAQAVGELEALSDKLRRSVAGFKLPPDISLETAMIRAMPQPPERR